METSYFHSLEEQKRLLARHGFNHWPDEGELLSYLFGLEDKAGNSSDFAGSMVECNKAPGRGANGHIAIGTYNVDRAVYHLGLQGVRFDQASRKTDAKGNTKAIYLQDEVGGFAIHLVKR